MDYKDAGVDRDEGWRFVEQIKKKLKEARPEVKSSLGGYGCFFEAPKNIKEPLWVATTDGVGTKLMLAEKLGGDAFRSVGQDVVAMCTNDLAACGADPIIFLDYLATGKLDSQFLEPLMEGIIEGCVQSRCALAGGETAEMPGFYQPKQFDVAGFAVGVIEKSKTFNVDSVKAGDIILGMTSGGFHSNGYSLIRHIMDAQQWSLEDSVNGVLLSEYLLKPTQIYVQPMIDLMSKVSVKGAAHITGGGLIENLPRIFSSSVRAEIKKSAWTIPSLQQDFVDAGGLSEKEAFSTWNMGIGFCAVIDASLKNKVPELQDQGWRQLGEFLPAHASHEAVEIIG